MACSPSDIHAKLLATELLEEDGLRVGRRVGRKGCLKALLCRLILPVDGYNRHRNA